MSDVMIAPDLIRYDHIQLQSVPALWHLPRAKWDKIWKVYTGKGVRVGVGDTGFTPHPDLPNTVAEKSFTGEPVRDNNGHGTHCAGTILGRNGLGVAPDAELVVAKVLSNRGSGSSDGIANGIRWMADQQCHIISLSLGGGSPYRPTQDAIKYAWAKGCMVIAAAGNSGYNGRNTVGYPAKFDECLCTGAIDSAGNIASFSSGGKELDWAAPGVQIISAHHSGRGYATMSGTSMATPFMAGIAALMLEGFWSEGVPMLQTAEETRQWVKTRFEDKGAPGHDNRFGHGVPRADAMTDELQMKAISHL